LIDYTSDLLSEWVSDRNYNVVVGCCCMVLQVYTSRDIACLCSTGVVSETTPCLRGLYQR